MTSGRSSLDKNKETVFTTKRNDYMTLYLSTLVVVAVGGRGGGTKAMFVNSSTRDMFASVNVSFISLVSHYDRRHHSCAVVTNGKNERDDLQTNIVLITFKNWRN